MPAVRGQGPPAADGPVPARAGTSTRSRTDPRAEPTERQKQLHGRPRRPARRLPARPRTRATSDECERSAETVAELDHELRAARRPRPARPARPGPPGPQRSTRRRQDAPNLPRRPVERRTARAGVRRPLPALHVPHPHPGLLRAGGRRRRRASTRTPTTTGGPPGTRSTSRRWSTGSGRTPAAASGWEVQYFGTVEPQRRGAPHFHAAIRGTIPRAELRAIAAATYHQVWWPAHDEIRYTGERLPRVGRPRRRVRRPRHRRRRCRPWTRPADAPGRARRTPSGSGRRCTSRASSAAPRRPAGTSATSPST